MKYDFIIIGAGGSGLAGTMYAGRLGMKTLVLGYPKNWGLAVGGAITITNPVENYPGFKSIPGVELAKKIEEHARNYKSVEIKNEEVKKIAKSKNIFSVETNKSKYEGKAILIATGTRVRKLDVKGAKDFEHRGISYCALCDGPLYKHKTVAVVGGSDAAAIESLILSAYAKKIYLIYRGDKIRPEKINSDKIKMAKNIEVINNTNLVGIKGDKLVKEVILNKAYKGSKNLKVDGVFIAIGNEPLSELAKSLKVKLNEKKEIVIDHRTCETNVKGIFAAGDVTDKMFKQLITGVADACTAAYSAYKYLKNSS